MNEQPRDPATEVHRIADPSHTRVASYLATREEVFRVLLLYSGGLDTSVMLKWIQDEYEAEVVALTVNLGQPGEDYEAIKANADYGDGYPLFTALGRPLIAKLAVEYARKTGCDTIAHGCTGKGNDQVRIEGTVAALAPELKVIAPVRSWAMGRDEEIAYARKHGILVKGGTESAPYSIDDNLWGRSSEGRWIEDLSHAPDDDVFQLVTRPQLAPDEPEDVTVAFEAGLWWEPLREDIEAYLDRVNERVTGTIGLRLYKGSARVITRESPNAVYDAQLATFAESGGLFSQQASPGFIEIWSLQSRMAHRLRNG